MFFFFFLLTISWQLGSIVISQNKTCGFFCCFLFFYYQGNCRWLYKGPNKKKKEFPYLMSCPNIKSYRSMKQSIFSHSAAQAYKESGIICFNILLLFFSFNAVDSVLRPWLEFPFLNKPTPHTTFLLELPHS